LTPYSTFGVPSMPWDTRSLVVPPNSASSSVQFIADPITTGGDIFDVVLDNPAVAVTLTAPGGTLVNAISAAGLGYQYSVYTVTPSNTPSPINPLGLPGTHTVIVLPAGAPTGTYMVNADSTLASVPSLARISRHSMLVLTDDLDLYRTLLDRGVDAVNFNHIRSWFPRN
ncbi:MAG: hypothetical protein ABSE86_35500, partial [Bryobacteraceae bacterium]